MLEIKLYNASPKLITQTLKHYLYGGKRFEYTLSRLILVGCEEYNTINKSCTQIFCPIHDKFNESIK